MDKRGPNSAPLSRFGKVPLIPRWLNEQYETFCTSSEWPRFLLRCSLTYDGDSE